jgi:homoserine O-acetyltransferase
MEGIFDLGDVELQSGVVLPRARLAYETHGTLNAARDNAIVYPTAYAGRHSDNALFIGAGRAFDPSKYFIVVPDLFGNGLSSSPSTTPAPHDRARFPLVTVYDNVSAQHRLLTEHLGVKRIALVAGYSMGAQQAFHWAALHAGMVERMAAICGSAKTTPHNWLFLEGLKTALQADSGWAGGDYDAPPARGLRAFATVYAGWFASQKFYRQGLHLGSFVGQAIPSMDVFLQLIGAVFGAFDANDLLAMLATWQAADVSTHPKFAGDLDRALGSITARALVMPCETDLYFPPEDSAFAVAKMPRAELRVIPSVWGHLAGSPMLNPDDVRFVDESLARLLAEGA